MADSDRILAAVLRAGIQGAAINQTLTTVGIQVSGAIKLKLSTAGSGRMYRRGGVVHQASAPGQPPAVDTGRLRSSYTWQLGRDARGPYVEVGTNVDYAPHLEFGTSRMAARPHVRPVVAEQAQIVARMLADGIARAQRAKARAYQRRIEQ